MYRCSLYNSDFYRTSTRNLLDLEIKLKVKSINRLSTLVTSLTPVLYGSLSFIDGAYIKLLLGKSVNKYVCDISKVHKRKLSKLGIHQPNFITPRDVIFNFSDLFPRHFRTLLSKIQSSRQYHWKYTPFSLLKKIVIRLSLHRHTIIFRPNAEGSAIF